MTEVEEKYGDILDLPYHGTTSRDPMDPIKRAAQFSPFAALTGHEEAIEETGRLTDGRIELDEDAREKLDYQLGLLAQKPEATVQVRYFLADARKAGGSYECAIGTVKKVDAYERQLFLTDGRRIPLADIIDISFCEC